MTKVLLIALATLMTYLVAKPYAEAFTRAMSRTQSTLESTLTVHTEDKKDREQSGR